MSFTWPEVPFTGAEVEAFVIAYKQLAEAIYTDLETYYDKVYPEDTPQVKFKEPYIDREFLKDLLEGGLIYASFIIKQRSGGGGPGTDFILGNTPLLDSLTTGQRRAFFEMIGCVFTQEGMKNAFNTQKGTMYPTFPDNLRDELIGEMFNSSKENIEQSIGDYIKNQTDGSIIGGVLDIGKALQRLWFSLGNKATAKIPDFMDRYFQETGQQFTANDMTADELADLKKGLQQAFDKGGNIRNPAWSLGSNLPPTIPRISSLSPSEAQRFAWGMQAGDTAYQVQTYGGDLELLLGASVVIKDSSGNIKSVHDDYDFMYGYEINRSVDGNLYGEPFNNNQVVDGGMYRNEGLTHSQVQQQIGNGAVADEAVGENYGAAAGRIGRSYIVSGHENGVGKPFPIKIIFP